MNCNKNIKTVENVCYTVGEKNLSFTFADKYKTEQDAVEAIQKVYKDGTGFQYDEYMIYREVWSKSTKDGYTIKESRSLTAQRIVRKDGTQTLCVF